MQFGGLFYAIMTLFKHIKLLLDAFISSNTFLCTWTIKIINYSVIKCQKNGAKMNKIVQKWQFQKIFYTTMETVLGFSQNQLAELFQNYVFSTNQYLYFDLYVAECQIQFFWPASRFGVYVYEPPKTVYRLAKWDCEIFSFLDKYQRLLWSCSKM